MQNVYLEIFILVTNSDHYKAIRKCLNRWGAFQEKLAGQNSTVTSSQCKENCYINANVIGISRCV